MARAASRLAPQPHRLPGAPGVGGRAERDWPEGLPSSEKVAYDLPEIRRWLELFHRRFFTNQFKRSTLPNGPKVVAGGSLSPGATGACPPTPLRPPGWPSSSATCRGREAPVKNRDYCPIV